MTRISVVLPLYQGERYLARVLPPIVEAVQRKELHEFLVVDDCSTDRGPGICREHGVRVLKADTRRGPGAARNLGASEATGEVLLFLDADTVMSGDVPSLVRETFEQRPDCEALFGSYDDQPADPGWISKYRNLLHHYIHQGSAEEASTFWAGCGAVRRSTFLSMGGFDTNRFEHASIEDIELGHRLRRAGSCILLRKNIQVKHLKRWTLGNMLFTDIFRRARPWSQLILEPGAEAGDLNLSSLERLKAGLSLAFWGCSFVSLFEFRLFPLAMLLMILSLAASARFYSLVLREAGPGTMATALFLHQLYYLYSSVTYAFTWMESRVFGRKNGSLPLS